MRAGGRPCQLRIYAPGNSEVDGEPNPPRVLLMEIWASIFPMRAKEPLLRGDRQSIVTYRARVDYLDGEGIQPDMTAELEGLTFNIAGVMRDLATKQSIDLDLEEKKFGA